MAMLQAKSTFGHVSALFRFSDFTRRWGSQDTKDRVEGPVPSLPTELDDLTRRNNQVGSSSLNLENAHGEPTINNSQQQIQPANPTILDPSTSLLASSTVTKPDNIANLSCSQSQSGLDQSIIGKEQTALGQVSGSQPLSAAPANLTSTTQKDKTEPSYTMFQIDPRHVVSPDMPRPQKIEELWQKSLRERLDNTLLRVTPGTSDENEASLAAELYMIGTSKTKLRPTILVTCCSTQRKQDLEEALKSQTWIRRKGLRYLVIIDPTFGYRTRESSVPQDPRYIIEASIPKNPSTLCGTLSRIKLENPSSQDSIMLTIGGLVSVKGALYGLTTAHPFAPRGQEHLGRSNARGDTRLNEDEQQSESSDEDSFSSREDIESTIDEQLQEQRQSRDSSNNLMGSSTVAHTQVVESLSMPDHGLHHPPSSYRDIGRIGSYSLDNVDNKGDSSGMPNQERGNQDWALICLDESSNLPNRVKLPGEADPTIIQETIKEGSITSGQVWVISGNNGPQSGLLNAACVSIWLGRSSFEVQQITLKQAIVHGDSGSWVLHEGSLCGYIIAGRGLLPWAYMIPIEKAIRNISQFFGGSEVKLPSIDEIEAVFSDNPGASYGDTSEILLPRITTSYGASSEELLPRRRTSLELPHILTILAPEPWTNAFPETMDHEPSSEMLPASFVKLKQITILGGKKISMQHINIRNMSETDYDISSFSYESLRTVEGGVIAPKGSQRLSSFTVICIIINGMIGSGIFQVPSLVIEGTQSVGIALCLWAGGAIAAIAGMYVYIQLGLDVPWYLYLGRNRSVPKNGGELNYFKHATLGIKLLSTCVFALVFILLQSLAGNALLFVEQITSTTQLSRIFVSLIAIAITSTICSLHCYSRSQSLALINIFAILKVISLLVIIVTGFVALGGGARNIENPRMNFDVHKSFATPGKIPYDYVRVSSEIIFAYAGYNQANYVLGEIRRPQAIYRHAALSAVCGVSVLYILVNIVFMIVVPNNPQQKELDIPMLFFISTGLPPRLLIAFKALSNLGNMTVKAFTAARVIQEIAKEGVLPFTEKFASNRSVLKRFLEFYRRWPYLKFRKPKEEVSGGTPPIALFLYWFTSSLLILITLSLPSNTARIGFSLVSAYTTTAFFGTLVGIASLRFCHLTHKKGFSLNEGINYRRSSYTVQSAVVLVVTSIICLILGFIPPAKMSVFAHSIVPTYISGTVTWIVAILGLTYWIILRFFIPRIKKKYLTVDRTVHFTEENETLVQKFELVTVSWIAVNEAQVNS